MRWHELLQFLKNSLQQFANCMHGEAQMVDSAGTQMAWKLIFHRTLAYLVSTFINLFTCVYTNAEELKPTV